MVLSNWKLVLSILDSGVVTVLVGGVFALLVLKLNSKGQFRRDRGDVAKELCKDCKNVTDEGDKARIERYDRVYKGLEKTFKK